MLNFKKSSLNSELSRTKILLKISEYKLKYFYVSNVLEIVKR